ncbi:hypothetical protein [Bradyrhizobium sp. Ce-3]|uniref:hypothetical protein n=1 Tax=Bradyrhizobium sp. Ce-3 TaxID=2913970 RepID=UPI001FC7F3D9|nr:hypothetical protein [Bradyrhizobium sp. Ce-3]
MLEILIVVLVTGVGFAAGYGVRELISRRRRRPSPRGHAPRRVRDGDGGDAAALLAANDDVSARGRRWPPHTRQADHATPPDELDGAVRGLLGELSRRTANPSSAPHRRRQ